MSAINNREYPKCIFCGKFCFKHKRKYCSRDCYNKDMELNIPKVPELLKMFKKYKTFVRVGKEFNVSDNAVRKWCIKYGILEMINK